MSVYEPRREPMLPWCHECFGHEWYERWGIEFCARCGRQRVISLPPSVRPSDIAKPDPTAENVIKF